MTQIWSNRIQPNFLIPIQNYIILLNSHVGKLTEGKSDGMDAAELWQTGDINQEKTLESKTQSKVTTKVKWDMNTITETREDWHMNQQNKC